MRSQASWRSGSSSVSWRRTSWLDQTDGFNQRHGPNFPVPSGVRVGFLELHALVQGAQHVRALIPLRALALSILQHSAGSRNSRVLESTGLVLTSCMAFPRTRLPWGVFPSCRLPPPLRVPVPEVRLSCTARVSASIGLSALALDLLGVLGCLRVSEPPMETADTAGLVGVVFCLSFCSFSPAALLQACSPVFLGVYPEFFRCCLLPAVE